MEQMNIPEAMQVKIDYEEGTLSRAVQELRPVVWKEESDFCCLIGPDPQEGVFGCGTTVDAALSDWEQHLNQRLNEATPEDAVAQYVKDTFRISKSDVW